MISLSLCMIVKNEEKVLPRILKPMKEIVDKILICDTGSTDRTKEIIREFTAEVYDFPWKNDFSAARNFISEKVSTDYWMWLDADDMITQENLYRLKQLKETLSPALSEIFSEHRWHTRIAYDKKVPGHNKISLWVPEALLLRSSVDRCADFERKSRVLFCDVQSVWENKGCSRWE